MKISFMNRLYFLVLLCLALTLWLSPLPIEAQTVSKGLTVIPPKFELFANPGDIVTEKVRLRNESDFPVTYTILAEDFSSSGEEGAVTLTEDSQPNSTYTLKNWMTPETTDLVLQPKEERTFGYTIAVPKDAEPGGHYASLLFQSGGDTVPGAAAVTSRVGALVLLRISGNVSENAVIENFDTPPYSQAGPITLSLRLKNNGNVHIRPKGTIIITNLLGRKVAELPLNGANVLPGAIRKMDTVWDKKNLLGIFTATMVAAYGQQNLPLTSAVRFTVISPIAAVLIGAAAVALIVFLITLVTGRKRFKKALKALTDNS
jgi:hypothetical protein